MAFKSWALMFGIADAEKEKVEADSAPSAVDYRQAAVQAKRS
jgi:hypothetical protein